MARGGPCKGHAMGRGGQADGNSGRVRRPRTGAAARQGGHTVGCVGEVVRLADGDSDGPHRTWGWPTEWRGGGTAMRGPHAMNTVTKLGRAFLFYF